MVDWTTVIISVAVSLSGGLITSHWQVRNSVKQQRNDRIKREKENWYHKVNSICLRIHRESFRLTTNVPVESRFSRPQAMGEEADLERTNELFQELLEVHTEAPSEVDREILDKIETFGFEYEHIDSNRSNPTTTDMKELLKENSESIMDDVSEKSHRYTEAPFR